MTGAGRRVLQQAPLNSAVLHKKGNGQGGSVLWAVRMTVGEQRGEGDEGLGAS
jgi:hypothetical protein